mgnify:CR=1 FL=1
MDEHPQNWFYWLNDYAPAVGIIMTVVFAVIGAGWALFTRQKSKAGSDLIGTDDPVDHQTIRNLNSLVDYFRAELDQRDIELADKEVLIAQLKTTLEHLQKIGPGGDDKLASRARSLLVDLGPGSLGADLLPDLRALIQDFEQRPIKDLIQLHLGFGALTLYGDPQASLAAYRRAHAFDPENIVAIDFIGHLEYLSGNLKAAEDAFRQVLDLGRIRDGQEAIAAAYGNLGNIAMTRGDLEAAAEVYTQALARLEDMGNKVGMAAIYGNLGNVAAEQGDLETAIDYHNQALALDKELGRTKGMAAQYGNLGNVAFKQGDLEMAVEYYNQALALDEELGRKEGMATRYGNLGVVAAARDDLDAALDYFNRALALDKELGRKEGMALNYARLGGVAVARGDLLEARQLWVQARGLFAEMGVQPRVAQIDEWLANLERLAGP